MAADKLRPHNPLEYRKLLEWASGASSILEIGSRYGYTLVDLAHGMSGKGTVVSIDLPGAGAWGNADSQEHLERNVKQLRDEGYDARLILGDSRIANIVARAKSFGPFDFAFIDGDHRYFGVKADWENYGPLAKRVCFHDIVKPGNGENAALEVWRLWRSIRDDENYTTQEFVAPGSKMGIGLVG